MSKYRLDACESCGINGLLKRGSFIREWFCPTCMGTSELASEKIAEEMAKGNTQIEFQGQTYPFVSSFTPLLLTRAYSLGSRSQPNYNNSSWRKATEAYRLEISVNPDFDR